MNERSRNFCLITYHSEETLLSVLSRYSSRVRHYAYILHDRDTNDDGSLKEKHFHLLLQLNNAMTLSAVRRLFPAVLDEKGKEISTLGQPMRDKSDCFVYLDHADLPDKYHYPHDDIKSDDLGYWNGVQRGEADDKTLNIIDDIIACVPFRELAQRYGRDLVLNFSRYRDFAEAVRREEMSVPSLPDGMTVSDLVSSRGSKPVPEQCSVFDDPSGRVIVDHETGEIDLHR